MQKGIAVGRAIVWFLNVYALVHSLHIPVILAVPVKDVNILHIPVKVAVPVKPVVKLYNARSLLNRRVNCT